MSAETPSATLAESVESSLRDELAQGDISLATTRPILRHLLAHADLDLFNDEVIAKVRGMVTHLARQVLFALAKSDGITDRGSFADERQNALAAGLMESAPVIGFAHALAVEALTAERLSIRSGIDAVLSPLLQELVASPEGGEAREAMRALSAQARFMQQQRRMELPLGELPAGVFETVCAHCEAALVAEFPRVGHTLTALREEHAESNSRITRLTGLIHQLADKAHRALSVDHAGVSMFVTALEMAGEQSREVAVLSLSENQCARLALTLRAAGLSAAQVEEQFLFLHPDITLPEGFDTLRADRASAALADSAALLERVS
ncbi:hypothetical protein [Erythrobacter sp. EC-HK427]|uniref:hypothetical protein n=1 Tax=Erythrobacter sp. EC-HK427 TaxID=2038396 RepID=UPI0012546B0E|nr:hypothetical protein [Erythrobacter sp. EC-HK427]VVT16514.1 conserved hypothetical protein [Erythrobacter sp. EC-HK427]